jgi:glutaconate CoA-transferase, subunit A
LGIYLTHKGNEILCHSVDLECILVNGQIFLSDLSSLVARIRNGTKLAIAKTECGAAMAATHELIRQNIQDLHLILVPTSGLQADLLIGAGCVQTLEGSGVTMGEHGQAPCFGRFVGEGRISLKDATCPAVYAGLQAAEKGIPYMPMRGLIGSDVANYRDDFTIVSNPFAVDDPIMAVRAIQPEVALFHAPLADRHGNVWIGRHKPLMLLAHASKETLVTVEKIFDDNLLDDPIYGPATIPSLYISGIVQQELGAWPTRSPGLAEEDIKHVETYMRLAATQEGLVEYLDRYVLPGPASAQSRL